MICEPRNRERNRSWSPVTGVTDAVRPQSAGGYTMILEPLGRTYENPKLQNVPSPRVLRRDTNTVLSFAGGAGAFLKIGSDVRSSNIAARENSSRCCFA